MIEYRLLLLLDSILECADSLGGHYLDWENRIGVFSKHPAVKLKWFGIQFDYGCHEGANMGP
jgi:hypothetical protein